MGELKTLKIERFLYPEIPRGLIVPIDHGLTMGPLPGIRNVKDIARWIQHPAITGIIAHKGMAERLAAAGLLKGKGLMIHLNGMSLMSPEPNNKVMLTTFESALKIGADAVSVQVNFNGSNDSENLKLLGTIVDQANQSSVPVLAMMYDKVRSDPEQSTLRLQHLIRIAIELGCEAVKISAPAQLQRVFMDSKDDIRLFVAGGTLAEDESLYSLARQVARFGGAGLCVGRNVFQKENVRQVLDGLRKALLDGTQKVTELPLEQEVYGYH